MPSTDHRSLCIAEAYPWPAVDGYKLRLANMIEGLMARRYTQVTRYATNTFLRAKLGDALTARQLAPEIFDSAEEAKAGISNPQ